METIRAKGVYDAPTYAQAIRAGNVVYLAGQVAVDENGVPVGSGDARAQAEQAWRNIRLLLAAAGTDVHAIVRVTTYVTNIAYREAVMEARAAVLGERRVASTLVAVAALARPEYLVEIEATAFLEGAAENAHGA